MKTIAARGKRPQVVPRSFGGKWVAWTKDAMRIVATGNTPQQAKSAAEQAGVKDIAYEWVPPTGLLY